MNTQNAYLSIPLLFCFCLRALYFTLAVMKVHKHIPHYNREGGAHLAKNISMLCKGECLRHGTSPSHMLIQHR